MEDDKRRGEVEATPSIKALTEGNEDGGEGVVRRSILNAARSGAAAIGTEATGQPSQFGSPFIPAISAAEGMAGRSCGSALSRAQIKMQAANSHKKLTGSTAAINLLSGKRIIDIAPEIIPLPFAFLHPG